MSKIVRGNTFSFPTQFKPLDFTFSQGFSIWRGPFTLQNDFWGNSVAKDTWMWYFSKNTILHFSDKYKFGTNSCSSCSRALFMLENLEKWAVNCFIEKTILLSFLNLSTIFCPRLYMSCLSTCHRFVQVYVSSCLYLLHPMCLHTFLFKVQSCLISLHFTCLHAFILYVFMCLGAFVFYALTCLCVLLAYGCSISYVLSST